MVNEPTPGNENSALILLMHLRFRFIALFVAVVLMSALAIQGGLASVASAAALQDPGSVLHLVNRTSVFTERERDDVARYVRYWLDRLASGEPEQMTEAMRRLREPLRRMGVTPVFRDEYSRAAVPVIRTLLTDDGVNSQAAVNALQIAAELGTERALSLMVERSESDVEDRMAVRLWAAHGVRLLLDSRQIGDGPAVGRAVRNLAQAAATEEHWLVLMRQFEAIDAAPTGHVHLVQAVDRVLARVEPTDIADASMQAVRRAAVLLRDRALGMAPAQQRDFGIAAAPTLLRVMKVAENHWDSAQEDERRKAWYFGAVQSAESLLKHLDAQVRGATPPNTGLHSAWTNGDREAFRRDVRAWESLLSQRPYQQ